MSLRLATDIAVNILMNKKQDARIFSASFAYIVKRLLDENYFKFRMSFIPSSTSSKVCL